MAVVSAFVDTSILVDLLRQYRPAVQWIRPFSRSDLGITPGVWMELTSGAQNKTVQQQAIKALSSFTLVIYEPSDQLWAMQQYAAFHLSHSVGMMDCLIASASHRLQIPLYTQNLKHFTPLLGSLAQSPY